MYNGRTAITRRGSTRGLQDDKMDEGDTGDGHDEGGPLGETTPPQIYKEMRNLQDETRSLATRPGQAGPMSRLVGITLADTYPPCVQRQQNSHTKVCQLRTGTCHHQSALSKETGSHEQSKDILRTSNKETYNQTRKLKASPHSIDKRMGHTYRTGCGKTALFKDTLNSTNHHQQCTKGSKYQTTNRKELSNKSSAEQ